MYCNCVFLSFCASLVRLKLFIQLFLYQPFLQLLSFLIPVVTVADLSCSYIYLAFKLCIWTWLSCHVFQQKVAQQLLCIFGSFLFQFYGTIITSNLKPHNQDSCKLVKSVTKSTDKYTYPYCLMKENTGFYEISPPMSHYAWDRTV